MAQRGSDTSNTSNTTNTSDTSDTSDAAWLQTRQPVWQKLSDSLPALEDRKAVHVSQIREAIRSYPELARDVAKVQDLLPDSSLAMGLRQVYSRLHRVLFKAPRNLRAALMELILVEAPRVAAHLRWQIFCVAIGFVVAALAGWWLVTTFPDLAGLFASTQMIDKVQSGELWTDHLLNIVPSSVLAVQIFTNNIVVSLTAVCLGALYGLGTIYIVGLNGLMLGGIFAFTAQHGMAMRLLEFVVAHGFVELSIIIIAGAVGFSIGEALARPNQLTRRQAFRQAATDGAKLIAVCMLFMVGAGIIEGFISPDAGFTLQTRLFVGIGYWCLLVFCLLGFRLPDLRPGSR